MLTDEPPPDFNLAQILPMEDEVTGADLQVIGASFCDPYLLILRDDSSVTVFKTDINGELEELERAGDILDDKWLSGCLYKPQQLDQEPVLCLLNADGGFRVRNALT